MRIKTLDDSFTPLKPESLTEWGNIKKEIIKELKFSSSIELLKHDAPLDPVISSAVEYDGFVVEKVAFQSLPGFFVTGNIYRPKDTTKKYPCILNPHGHWDDGRISVVDRARIPQRCANFAKRGMVAFIYDMIGFRDCDQISHEGFREKYEDYNFGRFSLQLNNSVKAIDFVCSLPYVDSEKIGCTGCSGGGTQTYFLTALDSRIKAAAPINMSSVHMQGGCICENTAFLRTRFCNIEYTMTAAPRPMFMAACDGDWTWESETVEFPAVKHVYSLYGAEDKFETFYRSAPHCYELPTRERAYSFFCRVFGIEDPFDGEQDMEFDTSLLLWNGLPEEIKSRAKNEDELFETVKEIIEKNLAGLPEEEKNAMRRRVFALDESFPLDIPYTVDAVNKKIALGECPAEGDRMGIKYYHTYNYADDTKRVNALKTLFEENKDYTFTADGKTAALCLIAEKLTENVKLETNAPDGTNIRIPGRKLL